MSGTMPTTRPSLADPVAGLRAGEQPGSCRRRRSRTRFGRRGPGARPAPARPRRRARPARPRPAGRRASGRRCRSRTKRRVPRTRTWPVATSTASTASSHSGVSVSETSEASRSPTATSVRAARAGPISSDAADEHAAAAGHRVVLLAALVHGRQDVGGDRAGVAPADVGDLLERGRVDVERLDRAQDLVGVRRAGVLSIRQAAWGSAPLGSSTRCEPSRQPVPSGAIRWASSRIWVMPGPPPAARRARTGSTARSWCGSGPRRGRA